MINTIIFDLGGVLIDWNPRYVFKEYFDDPDQMEWFLNTICSWDWNENQDAGYPLAQATEDKVKEYPEWEKEIRVYYGRWEEMLGEAIDDTVAILKTVIDDPKYRVYALTNWSAETFPIAQERFDFLNWFEGIVVSGIEKTRKPLPEIYQIILDRYQVNASEAIFIDDSPKNVKGSEDMGIQAIHFQSPVQLKEALQKLGILAA